MGKLSDSSLFLAEDFRLYVRNWGRARGRGEFKKIALSLRIHTTLLSQVLSGRKTFTEAQASRICAYMGLNALETDYFIKLVQIDRAETEDLKRIYRRHLSQLSAQAKEASRRVPASRKMSERDSAIYYSSWQYSQIRLLTSIEGFQTATDISRRLSLSMSRTAEILDFLVSCRLCVEHNGRYSRTEENTHVEARSPLSIRHHQNWRSRSLGLMEALTPDDLAFTAPVAVSRDDVIKIRNRLLDVIAEVAQTVKDSPSEETVYLAVDWIKI
jgi:uncharacterized protein (TIGR02147 family)